MAMMGDETVFVDANVLIYSKQQQSPFNETTTRRLEDLEQQGAILPSTTEAALLQAKTTAEVCGSAHLLCGFAHLRLGETASTQRRPRWGRAARGLFNEG